MALIICDSIYQKKASFFSFFFLFQCVPPLISKCHSCAIHRVILEMGWSNDPF